VGSRNNKELVVSYLLFVDDILIFCETHDQHLCHLRWLFLCIEAVSKLKINLSKSELVLVRDIDDVGGLVRIVGCKVASFLVKYLGLSLRALYKAKPVWDGIVEIMEEALFVPFLHSY
jgi:hypothetical protein